MDILKVSKDNFAKALLGTSFVPAGLVELNRYFRLYGPITFSFHKEDGITIATSIDFRYGSIVTQGVDEKEVDINIKDAILTAFELPSAYKKEADIIRSGERKDAYAIA